MTAVHNTRTVTSNIASVTCMGRRSLGAKIVIVTSDNRNVYKWLGICAGVWTVICHCETVKGKC